MLGRFVRTFAITVGVLAVAALVIRPDRPRLALGVLGGGVLGAVAVWAIRAAVLRVVSVAESGENRPNLGRFALVKFFTRHAILALTAYGMMLGLQLDPVGIVAGVSALWVAAAVEALRSNRR